MSEKFQKYLDFAIEITFYVLIIFAPVFFDRRIGIVFSLSKATWIRALTLIMLGFAFTKIFTSKGNKFFRSPLDVPVLTYLLVVAASTLVSINVWVSFIGSYGRYEGFITILNYVVLFFLTTNFIDSIEKKRRVMVVSLISSVVMGVYGIIQRLGIDPFEWGGVVTNERVIATIGQPNFLAAYLAMAFIFGIYLLFTLNKNFPVYISVKNFTKTPVIPKKKKQFQKPVASSREVVVDWNEIIYQLKFVIAYVSVPAIFIYALYRVDGLNFFIGWLAVYFIISLITIYFAFNFENLDYRISAFLIIISLIVNIGGLLSTQSRGGLVGLLCGLSVFAIICGRDTLYQHRVKLIVAGVSFLLVAIISFATIGSRQIQRFLGEVEISTDKGRPKIEAQGAAGSRIETWTSAFRVISDNMLFGIGPEVIKMRFPQYETPKFRFKEAFHVKQDRAHNETLDMTVTRGLAGLVVYVWLISSAFILALGNIKIDKNNNVFSAALLGVLTAYLVQNQFSFGVVAITSLFWIMMGMIPIQGEKPKVKISEPNVEMLLLTWLVIMFLLYISSFPYIGDKYFKTAQNYAGSGQFEKAFENFDQALKYMTFDGGYYTNYGMTILNSQIGKPLDAKLIQKAIEILEKGQRVDPYNADNFYMAARGYIILSDMGFGNYMEKAKELSEKAITIDPYYSEAYQNLSYISEKSGKMDDAIAYYEKAFEAMPINSDIAFTIYRYYKQKGQAEKAFKVLEKPLELEPNNQNLLLVLGDIYRESGLFDKAKEKYESLLKINPSNVKAIVGIGMIYLQQNNDNAAYEKFQEAMMIEPDNPILLNAMGTYYIKHMDKNNALKYFKKSLEVDSSNSYAKRMLDLLK